MLEKFEISGEHWSIPCNQGSNINVTWRIEFLFYVLWQSIIHLNANKTYVSGFTTCSSNQWAETGQWLYKLVLLYAWENQALSSRHHKNFAGWSGLTIWPHGYPGYSVPTESEPTPEFSYSVMGFQSRTGSWYGCGETVMGEAIHTYGQYKVLPKSV